MRFKEIGDELQYCLLTNKGAKETRWVRAELQSIQTYLRNLPALGVVHGREVEECAQHLMQEDRRKQKSTWRKSGIPSPLLWLQEFAKYLKATLR